MRKNILKISCVFVGLIFGAGFASGQEHLSFFLRFGELGLLGILLSALILGLCGYSVMKICLKQNIRDYKSFMLYIFGSRLGWALDLITGKFIFVIVAAMLAGAGAMGQEVLGLPFSIGVILLALLCFIVIMFDMKGIVEINVVATPLLILGAVALGVYSIFQDAAPAVAIINNNAMWPISAVLYASYNMITTIAVLATMSVLVINKKTAVLSSFFAGASIALVGLVLALALMFHIGAVHDAQLPMLVLGQQFGVFIGYGYAVLLFIAIFTTAATNAYALVAWVSAKKVAKSIKKLHAKLLIMAAAIIAAHLGFSNMVAVVYPIFGFLGMFIVVAIIIKGFARN